MVGFPKMISTWGVLGVPPFQETPIFQASMSTLPVILRIRFRGSLAQFRKNTYSVHASPNVI